MKMTKSEIKLEAARLLRKAASILRQRGKVKGRFVNLRLNPYTGKSDLAHGEVCMVGALHVAAGALPMCSPKRPSAGYKLAEQSLPRRKENSTNLGSAFDFSDSHTCKEVITELRQKADKLVREARREAKVKA